MVEVVARVAAGGRTMGEEGSGEAKDREEGTRMMEVLAHTRGTQAPRATVNTAATVAAMHRTVMVPAI